MGDYEDDYYDARRDQALYEAHYPEAISEFTSERLQSYYLEHPDLAGPAWASLSYAQSLLPTFPQAALVFAVTATELTVKTVLLKPIISGLVHTEELASLVSDLTTKHTGMDRFQKLLTEILTQFGGVELMTFKRANSTGTLWEEMDKVQNARNGLIHRGERADDGLANLAVSVTSTLLTEIFPKVLATLGLHLDKSRMTVTSRPAKSVK